ncbi:MAG: hypothetical protein A4E63_00400 [Syntrophorhabdus sp. PtaU1.Bin050]|nr:MAG: hypothetical protein A4E63_00400 [Syntrophorhabdus sp. PtaU1.Bin050]
MERRDLQERKRIPVDGRDSNIAMLQLVAENLGDMKKKVVFLGGTIIPFLLTRKVPLDLRPSRDVDFIVDFDSKEELYEFEDELWEQGFKRVSTGAVSKWKINDVSVDVLPAGPVLDFNNKWCNEAMDHPRRANIGKGMVIDIMPAPCFLGVKLTGFYRRGKDSYARSFDIYDLLVIMAGRPEIEKEIQEDASRELRKYLSRELRILSCKGDDFHELMERFCRDSEAAKSVLPQALSRIRRIGGLN